MSMAQQIPLNIKEVSEQIEISLRKVFFPTSHIFGQRATGNGGPQVRNW